MVCGGDVRVLFTYIPAEDRLWHVLAATLLDCIAKYQPGYLALPLSGAKGYLTRERPQAAEVFALPIAVGERAILFGAGHCSLALCPVLKSIGFRVTVFDDRADLVTAERFPDAERLICGDFASISRYITVEPEEAGFTREDVRLALDEDNIESRPLWKPMHLQPVFKNAPFYGNGTSERLFEIGLCLPSGPTLTDEDVERVVKVIYDL